MSQRPELALNGSLAGVECGKLLIDDRVQVFREQLWIAMIQAHGLTNAAVRRIIWDPLFSRDPLPSRPFQEAGCQKSFRLRAIMFKAYRSIQEADITVERLRSLLETAVIDAELDEEGDLYLTGSGVEFPIFVRLDSDRKMIQIFTYIRKTAIHAATVALRLNELNSKLVLGQFHHLEDAVYSRHGVSFDGGLLPRQFVKTVRRFSGSFREAIVELGDLLTGEDCADAPS